MAHGSATDKRALRVHGYHGCHPLSTRTGVHRSRNLRPDVPRDKRQTVHFVRRVTRDTVREALDIGGAHPRRWRSSAGIPGAQDAPLVFRWARVDLSLLLQVLPLDRWWRGSVYSVGLVGPDPSKTGSYRSTCGSLVVDGSKFRLGASSAGSRAARKSGKHADSVGEQGPRLARQDRATGGDWRAESALVSATPPTP